MLQAETQRGQGSTWSSVRSKSREVRSRPTRRTELGKPEGEGSGARPVTCDCGEAESRTTLCLAQDVRGRASTSKPRQRNSAGVSLQAMGRLTGEAGVS